MRTKEEIQNHIDECNSIISNLYEEIKYYEECIKEDETDLLELEQSWISRSYNWRWYITITSNVL